MMGKTTYETTDYQCNSCGHTESHQGSRRPKVQATGAITFCFNNGVVLDDKWWLCGECARILDKFLGGSIVADEQSKHLLLLDERFNDWWTEHCRMVSALQALGVNVATVLDGTSTFVADDLRANKVV